MRGWAWWKACDARHVNRGVRQAEAEEEEEKVRSLHLDPTRCVIPLSGPDGAV